MKRDVTRPFVFVLELHLIQRRRYFKTRDFTKYDGNVATYNVQCQIMFEIITFKRKFYRCN